MSYRDRENELSGVTQVLAAIVTVVGIAVIVTVLVMMPESVAPSNEHAMARAAGSAAAVALPVWAVAIAIVLRKRTGWLLGALLLFSLAGVGAAYSRIEVRLPTPIRKPKPELRMVVPGIENAVQAQPIDTKKACQADPQLPFCSK